MIVNWLMFDSVVALFLLGVDGASLVAVPLGATLFWMIVLASGRLDMLFERPRTTRHVVRWVKIAGGSMARCLALVLLDYELGRATAIVSGLETASGGS